MQLRARNARAYRSFRVEEGEAAFGRADRTIAMTDAKQAQDKPTHAAEFDPGRVPKIPYHQVLDPHPAPVSAR